MSTEKARYARRTLAALGATTGRARRLREKAATSIANWALIHIAPTEYQLAIYALVEAGREAALNAAEGER